LCGFPDTEGSYSDCEKSQSAGYYQTGGGEKGFKPTTDIEEDIIGFRSCGQAETKNPVGDMKFVEIQ
jgi:hypothetical protein